MKHIKLLAAAVALAATLMGAAPQAITAAHGSVPTVASLCCFVKK